MKLSSEIIIYQSPAGNIKIDVRLEDETVWLTQKLMAELFQTTIPNINMHLKSIYEEKELAEGTTIKDFLIVQKEGNREINRKQKFYNLDVIISVGYRIKSQVATQFRVWATKRLKEYIVKGFTLNDDRFKTGNSMNYFNELQERLREIRLSERFFYQKIKDIYATSIDYDQKDEKTIEFFKVVQKNCFGRSAVKQRQNLFIEEQTPHYPYRVCNLMIKTLLFKSKKVMSASPKII
jgi:hypothetical protein